jgi:hypothetical protein
MFLVSLGVLAVALAGVAFFARRGGSDQTATTRPSSYRGSSPPAPRRKDEVAISMGGGPLRAGLALGVLATFVGVIVALTIAGGLVFVAEGLRTAVR